ncbi:MAG: phosphodiester glycosidase family protein, partial [Chloroflexi bacterium]
HTPTLLPPTEPAPTDTTWERLRPGLERRYLLWENGQTSQQIYLLRIDPQQFEFRVGYRPGNPQTLAAWQAETNALVVVNGGFFTETYQATGLIVVNGVASGVSYGDFAGMLAITPAGPEVRWLAERPYDPAEPLQYALQSFPLLVKPGGTPGFTEQDERVARRTAIAQDKNGRILFILAPEIGLTLHEFSHFLATAPLLNLYIALNLDGGTSTGLRLADPQEEIPAFVPLPVVITVHSR